MSASSSITSRLLRRHRRALAALSAGVSVLALGAALQPPPGAVRAVVVAIRDLPVGHRLTPQDLAVVEVPDAVLPEGVVADAGTLVDQVLSAPVSRGEAVAPSRLLGSAAFREPAPPGTSPMPVRLPDAATASLLAPGQRIDLLATRVMTDDLGGAAPARRIATDVLVLAVVGLGERTGGLLDTASAEGQGPVVVLAVDEAQAVEVAGAATHSRLAFTVRQAPR